jgi:hypothetical protein
MTQDEIIEMARQAGIEFNEERIPETGFEYQGSMIVLDELEAFAKLVEERTADKEREACAKLVEVLPPVSEYRQLERATFKDAATAIRARGQE